MTSALCSLYLTSATSSGEVQPADGSAARAALHGPEGRGLPLLQAHAGQRAPRHPAHGDAAR